MVGARKMSRGSGARVAPQLLVLVLALLLPLRERARASALDSPPDASVQPNPNSERPTKAIEGSARGEQEHQHQWAVGDASTALASGACRRPIMQVPRGTLRWNERAREIVHAGSASPSEELTAREETAVDRLRVSN